MNTLLDSADDPVPNGESEYSEGDEKLTSPQVIPPPDAADESSTESPNASPGRRIAGAALIIMLGFVLSRFTGLAREIIIGARFGTGLELDAYLAAFRIPDLLFQLMAGGALGSAFIPTFSTYWARSDQAGAWLLFSRVLNAITLLLTLLAGLAAIFALPLVEWVVAPGFSPAQQAVTAELMRWMLISTVIFGASGLIMGVLNALQHFAAPAFAPTMYNLSLIAGAWWLAPQWGIYGLVIGGVVGAILHLCVQLPALFRRHVQYSWDWHLRDAGVVHVVQLMGPRVLGLLFVQLHFLINTILASGLATGSLSALNYAWLLLLLPQGIFAQAVATAAFPTLAAQVASQQMAAMRRTFGQTLRLVFFLAIPAAVVLYVLRVPLIQVLLQRGEFDIESTLMVAHALQFYALGLVGHAVVEIAVRAFYAMHNTWTPVLVGVAAMALNILFSLWWVDSLGFGGLALANSVATTLEMVVLLWLLRRRMAGLELRKLLATLLRAGFAALVMGGVAWWWLRWLPQMALSTSKWFVAFSSLGMCAAVYLGLAWMLGSAEMRSLMALLRRRMAS